MLITTLMVLLGFASIFGLIAGLSKDRVYLLPMSAILILCSGMMLTSGSLQVDNGFNATEEQIDSNTTEITQRPSYKDIDQKYSGFEFTTLFSVILLIISLYSIFLGADLTGTLRKD
jgi:hypothetical protein